MAAHREAAHRKPKQRLFTGPAARTAATLALAGAATATALEGAAQADPQLTPAQVEAKVDRLYHDAEVATEKYNGAKEEAAAAEKSLDALRDEAARRTERSTPRATPSARSPPRSTAAAASTPPSGWPSPPTPTSIWSAPPTRTGRATARPVRPGRTPAGQRNRPAARPGRGRAGGPRLTPGRAEEAQGRGHAPSSPTPGSSWPGLTAEQRADYERSADAAHGGSAVRADRGVPRGSVAAPNARAAQAVAFAYGALGKPYVWGATGPSSFDCSGLTQAAWRAAGVSLPRTTYTQINAGQRVSRSELAPGDLVFFYSGVTHVGLYIGGGQMIHAPRPGAPVRIAPISEMPFAGATRVA